MQASTSLQPLAGFKNCCELLSPGSCKRLLRWPPSGGPGAPVGLVEQVLVVQQRRDRARGELRAQRLQVRDAEPRVRAHPLRLQQLRVRVCASVLRTFKLQQCSDKVALANYCFCVM